MPHKAIARLTLEEKEEFKKYLEIHKMAKGKSLWEDVKR